MIKRLFITALLSIFASTSQAQFTDGQVLTATQLNNAFANVLPLTGGTLTGPLILNSTPLAVSSGGTGATASTGTGNVVLASSPTLTSPLFTNGSTTNGTIVGNAPASSLAQGLLLTQSASGTTSGNCTTDTLIMYPCANLFYVSSDNVAAANPTNAYDEWQFAANFGGSSLTGARQTMDVIGHFTAPSSPSNTNKGYDALAAEMITNSGDGGTAPDTVHGQGSFFATNPVVIANSGAQNLYGVAGEEIDVGCNGCSTAIRFGLSSANFGTSQAAILNNDAALHVGNIGGAAGGAWHQALNLSNVNGGAPLDTSGCVICTDSTNNTIATGIDLSHYTITGNFLAGPSGFAVSGAGALSVPNGAGIAGGLNVTSGGAAITGALTVSPGTTSVAALTSTGITNSPISGSTGSFTTLAASGTVSGSGFSSYLASPPAIGGIAPAAGTFTSLKGNSLAKVFTTNTSGQSIASGSATTVTGWATGFDANSNFTTSTGTFTAPATGYYVVTAQLGWGTISGAGASGQIKAIVNVNGSATSLQGVAPMSNATQQTNTVQVSGIVSASAGQTITLAAYQNSGSAVSLLTGGSVWMSIYQLP